ncbi:hypothetical protein JL721_2685 [Aureococcus anophagefferens]|nr:hypothetical protein JL721_2685 [Aureococcus anophagefferens]
MVAAAALLALASLAGAAPTYVTIPPQRCGLQNVPHDPGRSTRIAVALFGLVRHNCTMANFERFLVAPLLAHRGHQYTMDVFLHANVVAKITNARTNEDHEVLPGYVDWARFAPCRYTLEDQDVLDIKLARLRRRVVEHGKDFYGDNGDSIKNLLRALYSLKQSAHLVPGAIYEYVRGAPSRSSSSRTGCSINGDLLMNDRFAMGQRDAMVDAYLTRVDTIANYSGATDGSRHGGLTGERHLLNTLQIHNVAVARMYEFCLRRVRAGGRIWLKLFQPLDDHQCPLELVDHCGQECMRDQPRCDVGVGCYQRGVHRQSRLFDGTDWCNNPRRLRLQQSSVGALIGKSDAAMKKRLGISDADEARRTVETLAACGGVSALAAACGSSVGDFGSGLWTGDDVGRRRAGSERQGRRAAR